MTVWRELGRDTTRLFSPIGFLPIDDVTQQLAGLPIAVALDVRDAGRWVALQVRAVAAPSGTLIFPALERRARPSLHSPRHYRVRLTTDHYVPDYRQTTDGVDFDSYPYDDASPPQVVVRQPLTLPLYPSAAYPFAGGTRVLRGRILDVNQNAVADAGVTVDAHDKSVTNSKGEFAVVLRYARNTTVPVDVSHQRSGRANTINITLPDALGQGLTVPL